MAHKRIERAFPRVMQAARENRRTPTPAEQKMWEAVRGGRIGGYRFRRQQVWGQYVLDFFCVEKMLAIEVDGSIHDDPEHKELDAERTLQLEEQGVRVIRFSNDDVLDRIEEVLGKIRMVMG